MIKRKIVGYNDIAKGYIVFYMRTIKMINGNVK